MKHKKTHCAHGHEFTVENSYIIPSTGWRCCRECRHLQHEKDRKKNPNKYRQYQAKWGREKRTHWGLYGRKFDLKTNYGLTIEKYMEIHDAQEGRCALCRKPETAVCKYGKIRSLSVDHDHACCPGKKSCGKCIRGLLCHFCNHALGLLKEDPALFLAAIEYIKNPLRIVI